MTLKKLREQNEQDLEPLLVLPNDDGDVVLVLLESQAGIYRLHQYHASPFGKGRMWHMNLIANPSGNIRDMYREINKFFE